jgi:hypothetical protein
MDCKRGLNELVESLKLLVESINNPALMMPFVEWCLGVSSGLIEPSIADFKIKFQSLNLVCFKFSHEIELLRVALLHYYATLQSERYELKRTSRIDCGVVKTINGSMYSITPSVNEPGLNNHLINCQYSWKDIESARMQLKMIIYCYYTQN